MKNLKHESSEELKKKYPSIKITSVGNAGEWDQGVEKGEQILNKQKSSKKLLLDPRKLTPEQMADAAMSQLSKK